MEFYDADVLIGRDIAEEEADATGVTDVLAEMTDFGVHEALITNRKIYLSNPELGNSDLAQDVATDTRLRGVFGIYVIKERDSMPEPRQAVADLIATGAAGVQLWPKKEAWDFAPWQCRDLFAALADYRLPAFIHADQVSFGNLHSVLSAWPDLRLIVQRTSHGDTRRWLALMQACPELYLAMSPRFVGGRVVEQFASYIGHERLLFASGLFTYDMLPAMAQITYADISDNQKADIAAGNLQRLLAEVQS
jgi:predicted TIM-barrel fold metal-dependent hydrolase